jgi:hypothetical protein
VSKNLGPAKLIDEDPEFWAATDAAALQVGKAQGGIVSPAQLQMLYKIKTLQKKGKFPTSKKKKKDTLQPEAPTDLDPFQHSVFLNRQGYQAGGRVAPRPMPTPFPRPMAPVADEMPGYPGPPEVRAPMDITRTMPSRYGFAPMPPENMYGNFGYQEGGEVDDGYSPEEIFAMDYDDQGYAKGGKVNWQPESMPYPGNTPYYGKGGKKNWQAFGPISSMPFYGQGGGPWKPYAGQGNDPLWGEPAWQPYGGQGNTPLYGGQPAVPGGGGWGQPWKYGGKKGQGPLAGMQPYPGGWGDYYGGGQDGQMETMRNLWMSQYGAGIPVGPSKKGWWTNAAEGDYSQGQGTLNPSTMYSSDLSNVPEYARWMFQGLPGYGGIGQGRRGRGGLGRGRGGYQGGRGFGYAKGGEVDDAPEYPGTTVTPQDDQPTDYAAKVRELLSKAKKAVAEQAERKLGVPEEVFDPSNWQFGKGSADGGMINGPAPRNPFKDNMMAPVQAGEYVIPRKVVSKLGPSYFDNLVRKHAGYTPNGSHATGYAPGGYGQGWNPPKGFTNFWPGGGHWEGPGQVKAGSDILGGHNWSFYDIANPNAPWIGLEGPRGSLGQWVKIPGENRWGRVIDEKQQGYGGYGVLRSGQYNRKGNWIGGGRQWGGGGGGYYQGNVPGFRGWTNEQVRAWHEGPGESQLGYPSYTGTDPAPGYHSMYNTTWYKDPQYGWVPQAIQANAQASTNISDYFKNQFQPGTGKPTQNIASTLVGMGSNFIIPGLGLITGPLTKMLISKWQQNHPGQQVTAQVVQNLKASKGGQMGRYNPNYAYGMGGGGGGGWYNPAYLRSIGYEPGQGTGSLWPGAGPSLGYRDIGGYGVGGGGGSFFHDLKGIRGGSLPGSFTGLGQGSWGTLGSLGGWMGAHRAMPEYGGMSLIGMMHQNPGMFANARGFLQSTRGGYGGMHRYTGKLIQSSVE